MRELAAVLLLLVLYTPAGVAEVRATQTGEAFEYENGLIKVRITPRGTGLEQEFLAFAERRWVPLVKAFLPPSERPDTPLTIFSNGPAVAKEYRVLTTEALSSVRIEKGATPRLILSGATGPYKVEQTISLTAEERRVHVEVSATIGSSPPKIEFLWSPFVFVPGKPDFTHAPTFKRAADNVLGDRIFYSPAVLIRKGTLAAALVPDLDIINDSLVFAKGARPIKHPRIFAVPVDPERVSMPTALDLELESGLTTSPLFGYGIIDFVGEQHVFWRHENKVGEQARELSSNKVRYGFDLFLQEGASEVPQYLWQRYGSRYFRMPRPQAEPLADYAKLCYPAAFSYKGFRLVKSDEGPKVEHGAPEGYEELETWLQWEENDVPVGGYRNSAPQWYSLIGNTPWWNNVRDAVGMHHWGTRLDDKSLVEKGRRSINLALSAPQDHGLFPGIFDVKRKRWIASHWKPPQEGYDPSRAERYFHTDSDVYQTAAMSFTAVHMLRYATECFRHPRIAEFVGNYADFLIANVTPDGFVPAWFGADRKPLQSLKWNSEGGIHIWLLAEMYRNTKEVRYLEAAERIARTFIQQVVPLHKWHDVEAFYSCAVKPETFFEPHTGQPARSALSMSWAIQGFALLHELTRKQEYVRAAEEVADYSAFFQTVWKPHFIITAYPFGGFLSQTGDAEWLDGRQSEFARAFARLGLLVGRQDLLERAVAAMRASLTLTNQPRHIENDIYKYPHYPLGIGPENIDHEGFPQKPHRSSAGWNEVSGLSAAADLLRQLGGAYVDLEKQIAVGVDGVVVRSFEREGDLVRLEIENQLGKLKVPYELPYSIELRLAGLPDGNYRLLVNGAVPRNATSRELASYPIEIKP